MMKSVYIDEDAVKQEYMKQTTNKMWDEKEEREDKLFHETEEYIASDKCW